MFWSSFIFTVDELLQRAGCSQPKQEPSVFLKQIIMLRLSYCSKKYLRIHSRKGPGEGPEQPKTGNTSEEARKQKKKIFICSQKLLKTELLPVITDLGALRASQDCNSRCFCIWRQRISGKVCTCSHCWNSKKLHRRGLNGTGKAFLGSLDEAHITSVNFWHCH